jgi:hypothetical protein
LLALGTWHAVQTAIVVNVKFLVLISIENAVYLITVVGGDEKAGRFDCVGEL